MAHIDISIGNGRQAENELVRLDSSKEGALREQAVNDCIPLDKLRCRATIGGLWASNLLHRHRELQRNWSIGQLALSCCGCYVLIYHSHATKPAVVTQLWRGPQFPQGNL